MAFPDDLVLKDATPTARTFSRQSQEANRCTWIDTSTTPQEPRILRISHRKEPIKSLPGEFQDRHTIEIGITKKDATTGKLYTMTVSSSIQYPLTGPLVRADLDHLVAFYAKGATPDAFYNTVVYVDRFLRSEL